MAAWVRHTEDAEGLAEYAKNMEELANRHWDGTGSGSRITWVKGIVKRYFFDQDWKRIARRAKRRALAAKTASGQIPKDAEEIETTGLDVGEKLKT